MQTGADPSCYSMVVKSVALRTCSWGRLGFDGDAEPYGACRVVGPVKSWHLHIIANDDVELAYAA